MRKAWLGVVALAAILMVAGCGSTDDFDGANRLIISSVANSEGGALVFDAVETTGDEGQDGTANTGDTGENGRWDEGESLTDGTPESDFITITLLNETRLGVEEGMNLYVENVQFTYLDGNGFTPTYAPARVVAVGSVVEPDSTADIEVLMIPRTIKTSVPGIREAWFSGNSVERASVRNDWNVVIDVWARDLRNDDVIHASKTVSVAFVNPNN